MINKNISIYIIAVIILISCCTVYSQVAISEVMSSNATTIADEDGDYEDWIELYNYGSSAIDPNGTGDWYYFDEPTPGQSNTSQGYSEILSPPLFSHQAGFYTNSFDLSITHPDPEVVIIYTLDGSEPDINNLSGTTYLYKNSYPELPGQPFGSFLENTIETKIYNGPIFIYDRSSEPDKLSQISSTFCHNPNYFPETAVKKAFVVRAKSYKSDAISKEVKTRTYFVFNQGNPYSLPVISLSTCESYLFDYEEGIYVAGELFDKWRINNSSSVANGASHANYRSRGEDFEVPAHFVYFDGQSGNESLNQAIGLRIHGGSGPGGSRRFPVKALRLYARSMYGRSSFDYPFFSNQVDSSFKRIILRNSGQDYDRTLIRDAAIQTIVSHLKFDTQDYQPAILFINGEYWGIHNIRERYDKHYLERVYGVDPENIDLLERRYTVKEGDDIHYKAMLDYIENHDLSIQSNYDYVQTQMDNENFIDYNIAQIFLRNTDWPGNNIDFWRLRTTQFVPDAPYGHDGRWRWMMFDTDFGFGWGGAGSSTHNTLSFATAQGGTTHPNPDWSTFLFRTLFENESFKIHFINRFADLLNTTFLSERMVSIIKEYKTNIAEEIPEHRVRWRNRIDDWSNNVNNMIDFANERPAYQRQHIRDHFNIANDINITLDLNESNKGFVRINTININSDTPGVSESPYPWTGVYFSGIPIEFEAIASPGYLFSHWTGDADNSDHVLNLTPSNNISLTAHFVKNPHPLLLHYWHFNTLSGTVTSVQSDYSQIGSPVITYPGTGSGYMDERTHREADPVSNLNLHLDQQPDQGAVLRVRNPSDTRELIIESPTTGYEDIVLNYATTRTSNGATQQQAFYSDDNGSSWISLGSAYSVVELTGWDLVSFDLSEITSINHNPGLKFKIVFSGNNAGGTSGNNRFDNISVHGRASMGNYSEIISSNKLYQNYPNPFNSVTAINYALSQSGKVELNVYNLNGQLVQSLVSGNQDKGFHKAEFNGADLTTGIYFYSLKIDGKKVQNRKMLLLK